MAHQDRIKLKKIIVVYVIWNVVEQHCNIFGIYVLLVHRPFPIVSFLTNGHFNKASRRPTAYPPEYQKCLL